MWLLPQAGKPRISKTYLSRIQRASGAVGFARPGSQRLVQGFTAFFAFELVLAQFGEVPITALFPFYCVLVAIVVKDGLIGVKSCSDSGQT
jgi:hypothetical protein